MRLGQYADYRWADTERIQEMADMQVRETMKRQGFSASEIEEALLKGQIPAPEKPEDINGPTTAVNYDPNVPLVARPAPEPIDLGLTDEDKMYLKVKWGSTYREDEWVQLERLYVDMMNSYDIQTAGHKDTLKMLCKTSLKANQLLDIGDVDGYQKMQSAYDKLMRSGNFTAVQNKTDNGDLVDSISELVMICEEDGFIPRYYTDEPQDKVDRVLQDLQAYTRSLIMDETNLGSMIESAVQQIQVDDAKASRINADEDEDQSLEETLFNDEVDNEDELDDDDFEEFKQFQEDERSKEKESDN